MVMSRSRNTCVAFAGPRARLLACLLLLATAGCMYHAENMDGLHMAARGSAEEANAAAADANRALSICRRALENAAANAADAKERISDAQKAGSKKATWRAKKHLRTIENEMRRATLATVKVDSLASVARNAATQAREHYRQTTDASDKIGARAHVRVASKLAGDARRAADTAAELAERLRSRWLSFSAGAGNPEENTVR